MANSLIPYSFVPGTKAMASEVNANFIALANSVEAGKQYTNAEIEKLNLSLEERLDEYKGGVDSTLDLKMSSNLANSVNISNCIIEVPQNIKVEFNAGTVTLKAGSVLTVPDGFEEDGVTPVYTSYTLEDDISTSSANVEGAFQDLFCCFNVTDGDFGSFRVMNSEGLSGSTRANVLNSYWYDTTSNTVKYVSNNVVQEEKFSLPLFLLSNINNTITGIKQVFNGFGFMGSMTWIDKGVRCLFADGRNADGTLKNFEVIQPAITFSDLSGEISIIGCLKYNATTKRMSLSGYDVNSYFLQSSRPVSFGVKALWFNDTENVFYRTEDSGVTWIKDYIYVFPKLSKPAVEANISAMTWVFPINLSPFEGDRLQELAPDFDRAYGIPNGATLQATEALWAVSTNGANSQFWAHLGSRGDNMVLWKNTQDTSNGSGTAAVSMFVPRGYFYNVNVVYGYAIAYPCKGSR